MGVLPFNQQVWHNGFKELVKIDTVDSYQGKENRIIIVSVGRSDNIKSVGFLDKSNRINVAMSRAMDRLFIVGNKEMWKGRNQKMPLGDIISYIEERGETPDYCSINSKEIKGQ
ncbi:AAA domain-containing protein [Acinetobacter sp. YH12243]|uniref:AAA domain-containing protein n=1 Tax=Acinetobacter sp. YH12243 TaxID=2601169 RepID=UPI0015D3975B|nr:C-terminal helicase domain-containing protein [Acinetobacter sp. YH12243]